jgi:hypothetical protein
MNQESFPLTSNFPQNLGLPIAVEVRNLHPAIAKDCYIHDKFCRRVYAMSPLEPTSRNDSLLERSASSVRDKIFVSEYLSISMITNVLGFYTHNLFCVTCSLNHCGYSTFRREIPMHKRRFVSSSSLLVFKSLMQLLEHMEDHNNVRRCLS